jgi:phosphoglycerol transferase MdoB-like AlkP superfamily enzyme
MPYEWLRQASRVLFAVAVALLVYGCAFQWRDPGAFGHWIREDGLVENLTALILAASGALSLFVSFRYRALERAKARTWLVLGCVLLFGALEEISWGQRIFGWQSPEWFRLHNAQQETNLHNLRFHGVKINKLVFGKGLAVGMLLYLGVLPLLYSRVLRVRQLVDRIALPLIRGRHVLVYLGALALVRVPLSLLDDSRAMEMGELVGAALFLMVLVDPLNPGSIAPLAAMSRRSASPIFTLRALPQRALLLLAMLALNFALFALYRIAFWLAFRGPESAADAGQMARALSLGFRFDMRLACLIVLPLLVLAWVRRLDPFGSRAARISWIAYFTTLAGACSLIYLTDFGHYAWVDRRIDVSVMEYAQPIGTALQVVWETYPVLPLLGVLALFLWGWAQVTRRCIPWAAAHGDPSPGRGRRAAATLALIPVLALGVTGRAAGYPLRWSHAFFTPDAFATALGLNPVLYLLDTWPYGSLDGEVDFAAAKTAYDNLSRYLGLEKPGPGIDMRRRVEPTAALAGRPNVVVIQLESFGANKVGAFGNALDPTPNFDRIARDSLFFRSFYTASRGTARSTFSLLTGIPDVTRRGSRNPLIVDQHVLVDEFHGYEKMYFYTGDLAWGNIRGLLQNNISGLRVFEQKDYSSPRNDGWGISDLHLFEEANARFRALGDRPFIAFLHTSGNHQPYTIPVDSKGFQVRPVADQDLLLRNGFRSQQEFDSLRFMDHSLGHFFALARQEPYWGRTLFLVFGDHGSRGSGTSGWQKIGLTGIHVPFVIYGPGLIDEPRAIDEPASSLDVLPTVAALAGVPHVNTALGRNLLAPRTDGEDFVFSEAGLVDREFFFTAGRLHRIRSADPTADLSAELPERRARMAAVWKDFRSLSLYLMHNNSKEQAGSGRIDAAEAPHP